MKLVAFDPGKTTGVCVADVTKHDFQLRTCFEMSWESRFEVVEALISGTYFNPKVPHVPEIVVAESFRLRQGRALEQAGSDFPSVNVIAIIQTFLYLHGPERQLDLKLQEPGMRSRVKVLDEHKQWVKGSSHKLDAYQHARLYWAAHIKQY